MPYPDGAKLRLPGGPDAPEMDPAEQEHEEADERLMKALGMADKAYGRLARRVDPQHTRQMEALARTIEGQLRLMKAPEIEGARR